jgi:predicted GNAT superfamily acetyltransferase
LRETTVKIRPLSRAADLEEILNIQRRVWGHGETDLTPAHQFRITVRLGAILLGGWIGRRLAGFVYSFPAVFEGRNVQHSHLLAVLPEDQGRGVGRSLKWAQRDRAIELGYDLITWTFDPLQAKNANLNIHSLGAVTRTYWRDFYGAQEALVLGPGIRTDRFLVEWPIKSGRVAGRRAGVAPITVPPDPAYALAAKNESQAPGRPGRAGRAKAEVPPRPGKPDLALGGKIILVEVPRAVNALRDHPDVIATWQKGLRSALEHYLARGYVVDDFIFGARSFYVLRHAPAEE